MTKYEKRYDVYTGMDKNEYIDWYLYINGEWNRNPVHWHEYTFERKL